MKADKTAKYSPQGGYKNPQDVFNKRSGPIKKNITSVIMNDYTYDDRWGSRLSTRTLACFVTLTEASLATFAFDNLSGFGNLDVVWTFPSDNFLDGMLRTTFSFLREC